MPKTLFDLETYAGMPPQPKILNPAAIPRDAKIPIPVGTYDSLKQIGRHCNSCHRCPLGDSRTRAAVGRGNQHAPIMLIGEAPGSREDEIGKPFVGPAGKLLEKMLHKAGISTRGEMADAYLCNVIKCRPPENRTPTATEIAACKGYLLEQIRLVDPKIIVLVGATAVRGLLGDKRGITQIRGIWRSWEGRVVMPILHPSYLLRNPESSRGSARWLTQRDLKLAKRKLSKLASCYQG